MRRLLLLGVLLSGCYETPKPACIFLCGEGDACPDGYMCGANDNRCHRVESGGGLASCPDSFPPDASVPIDGPTPIDGPQPIDSSVPDAVPLDAFTACSVALAPVDDGTSAARQALLLAEVNPGDYIELYNNTGADIDLDASTVQIVSGSMTVALSTAGAGVTIHASGRHDIPWPAALTDANDAGGEVVLYLNTPPTAAEMMSFVCWGAAPTTTFKADAEGNGKWTAAGACPAAITGGAIHRLPATDGLDAADFDIAAAPSPETCAP